MKFNGKALFILIVIGSLNSVLSAQEMPTNKIDETLDKATITEQNINTASSPYRSLKADEVINTMYPDPLAEGFMGQKDSALDLDRNRSVSDMLEEFEGQAKVINDATVVPENIKDNHSKEDRERIEARAEKLLREKALNDSADNKGEKRVKDNIQDNVEVLYKEEIASESAELVTDSIGIASDSSELASDSFNIESHQDINTAQIKDWPEAEDPEFAQKESSETSEDETEIILIDDGSKPLPDEIPDYANMSGITKENSTVEEVEEEQEVKPVKEAKKVSRRDMLRKKMATPLAPVLLTMGKPKDEDDENGKTFSYSGILIPEKQPISRRKKMIRWTLQLDDGTRIPIKSNLKLLQEVRKEENLDDYVTITGKMRKSALEDQLKYFVPETIVKGKKGVQGEVVDDKKSRKDTGKGESKKGPSGVDNRLANKLGISSENASDSLIVPETAGKDDIASDTQNALGTENVTDIATDTNEINNIIASNTVALNDNKAEENK